MKGTDLLRFVIDNSIEYRWEDDDVIMWVNVDDLPEFQQMIDHGSGGQIFDDGGFEVNLCSGGYVAIEMEHICSYFGIELEDVFVKDKNR